MNLSLCFSCGVDNMTNMPRCNKCCHVSHLADIMTNMVISSHMQTDLSACFPPVMLITALPSQNIYSHNERYIYDF